MLEVCVDTVESAINAEKGGASRIELCSALSEGGLTPSVGVLKTVKSIVSIPVYVMLRPRRGMDFVYTKEEIASMKYDASSLKEIGADGFVFGALNADATINTNVCQDLLDVIRPLPVTFHRAFDVVADPYDSLSQLIALGFSRVLTGGQMYHAVDGLSLIKRLLEFARNRIIIMPGGGINADNVDKILTELQIVEEIHASCRTKLALEYQSHKRSASLSDDFDISVTDINNVRRLVTVLERYRKNVCYK